MYFVDCLKYGISRITFTAICFAQQNANEGIKLHYYDIMLYGEWSYILFMYISECTDARMKLFIGKTIHENYIQHYKILCYCQPSLELRSWNIKMEDIILF